MTSGKRDINRRKGKKRECNQNEMGMKQIKNKIKDKGDAIRNCKRKWMAN